MGLLQNDNYIDRVYLDRIFNLDEKRIYSSLLPWISHSANGYYYPLIPVILFIFDPANGFSFLVSAIVAFLIELPAYKIIKRYVKRFRPYEVNKNIKNRIMPSDRFSLPSGHTAAAWVIAILLGMHCPLLMIPMFLWATAVGVSRVYLGVHYPTDILAGFILGILSSVTSILITGQIL
jgi:undecaprenyl-diphosphatase